MNQGMHLGAQVRKEGGTGGASKDRTPGGVRSRHEVASAHIELQAPCGEGGGILVCGAQKVLGR